VKYFGCRTLIDSNLLQMRSQSLHVNPFASWEKIQNNVLLFESPSPNNFQNFKDCTNLNSFIRNGGKGV
jgi:hypothetical protein